VTTTPSAADMIAQMRALLESLPDRLPTVVRVGPGVTEELNDGKPVTRPLLEPPLPLGMDIILDPDYPPGQWRIFDQHGEEMSDGVLPVPGATVRVQFEDGTSKDMRVMTVSRDDQGRIREYTVADAALVDGMPYATDWLFR